MATQLLRRTGMTFVTPRGPYRPYLQAVMGLAIAALCFAVDLPDLGAATAATASIWLSVAVWQHVKRRKAGQKNF